MKNECQDTVDTCSGRREFLVSASAIAGSLVLSLSASAQDKKKDKGAPPEDIVLKLDDQSPLGKVGGSQVVETKSGKIIVARTSDTSFVALSAKCTHSGGTVDFDEKAGQFKCPRHGSRFGLDGSNAKGPADSPLKAYKPQSALVVSIGE